MFVCGFYGDSSNITALGTILDHAKRTDTEVAIFPAHNENSSNVLMAATEFDSVKLVDWQSELQSLTESGVAVSDLRKNDSTDTAHRLPGT